MFFLNWAGIDCVRDLIAYFVPDSLMRVWVLSKAMAEFKSHDDYWEFWRSVIGRARYVFEPHAEEFLNTVIATVGERVAIIEPNSVLLRAQLGFEWRTLKLDRADPNSETVGRAVTRPSAQGIDDKSSHSEVLLPEILPGIE